MPASPFGPGHAVLSFARNGLALVLLPDECFRRFPHGLTPEGQYIMKLLILASAVLVLERAPSLS
jgi:hypothetical protein